MVNFGTWRSANNSSADESQRAVSAWSLIQRSPTEITLKRLGTAQTVRVEYSNTERELVGSSAGAVKRDVVVFGVRNHPGVPDGAGGLSPIADTDIRRDDQFALNGQLFKVVDMVFVLGGLQAHAQALS